MSLARDERAGLAADLLRLGPDAPTLCEGWSARDLLTHMLLRENDPLAIPGMAVSVFDALTQARADKVEASGSFEDLVVRFAHGPDRFSVFRVPGMDAAANSMEYFIHHEDLLRAQPDWRPRPLGHRVELQLAGIIRKYGRALARRSPVGVRVEMTAVAGPLTLHPGDRIVTIVGKPSEILLLLTGRTSVAQVDVLGEPETVAEFLRSDHSL
ncbi:TIGR03085 family metal-binding protein [Cutibacterium equinum]|uniref:TIGR03085 family metal-binding protein n=1 Tax=Cutibacterium equinum TaxID=3016342 RepID=A0ABY7R1L6_9ACTN|nr:TIGR03085 family metal-binding protein [Cutibacterium equinum]WCC80835.1 TIGR03085 family metal-binding protein [Cutibacterium equinum]